MESAEDLEKALAHMNKGGYLLDSSYQELHIRCLIVVARNLELLREHLLKAQLHNLTQG